MAGKVAVAGSLAQAAKLIPTMVATRVAPTAAAAAAPILQTESGSADRAAADQALSLISGEVKKVDKDARKLTIKHGPITNLQR